MGKEVIIRIAVRTVALLLLSFGWSWAQPSGAKYNLQVPANWTVWVLSPSPLEARRNYVFADDKFGRAFIEAKINAGGYGTYKPGEVGVCSDYTDDACYVTIVNDPGKRGWVHLNLLKMTAEARAAAKKAAAQKEQQAAAAAQKERAYVDSLPKLVSEGSTVVIATSIDCAKDLQNVIGFGRKNGTGVEYRKKMLELVTLGCATTMDNGTALLHAAKNGDFVAFTAYKSGKQGVALKENVRWP